MKRKITEYIRLIANSYRRKRKIVIINYIQMQCYISKMTENTNYFGVKKWNESIISNDRIK